MADLSPPPASSGPREVARFLGAAEDHLARLDRAVMLAEWSTYTGHAGPSVESTHLARTRFLTVPGMLGFVERRDTRAPDSAERRTELLRRAVLEAHVEQAPPVVRLRTRLETRVVRSRPRLHGRRMDRASIGEILRTHPDPQERRRAYYAEESVLRPLEEPVRELVHLRDDAARSMGFRSFPEMRLGFEGLSVAKLRALVEAATSTAPARVREFRDRFLAESGRSEWYPWDLTYARERRGRLPDPPFPSGRMAPSVASALSEWGFSRSQLRFRLVRCDLPFGGLTIVPSVPDDVRVLVPPKGGWTYYMVLFHEFGHATHARSIRQPTHLLRVLDPGYSAFHEGVADLFEEIASTSAWLERRPGIGEEAARRFREGRGDEGLLRAVSMALATQAELDLYRDPDRDPSGAHHRRMRRVFGFDEFPARSFVDSFYVTHPVYLQSYLLALLFRKQVRAAMLREVGGPFWPNRRVARWLTDRLFRSGARHDWIPRVREVTGRPFGAEAFLDSVRRREP